MPKKIKSALISVFYKDGLEPVVKILSELGITIYSTGGTRDFIESLNVPVTAVENLTSYPSILGGRVKTLHPSVFGGILARRDNDADLKEMEEFNIPEIDLVIVGLYPFEETVHQYNSISPPDKDAGSLIIEKIDIGGPSMLRGAAKNFKDVLVVADRKDYAGLEKLLQDQKGETTLEQRRAYAAKAFEAVAHYDIAIAKYFRDITPRDEFSKSSYFLDSVANPKSLRYGENPHQAAVFYGEPGKLFEQLNGKELSYNNLVDVDAALQLINEYSPPDIASVPVSYAGKVGIAGEQAPGEENITLEKEFTKRELSISSTSSAREDQPKEVTIAHEVVFAIIKHTNACGVAMRPTVKEAWEAAIAGDPESAFGGVLICNAGIDKAAADTINEIFFEVLIAPDFDDDALNVLKSRKNRILLKRKPGVDQEKNRNAMYRSLLNGVLVQETDRGNYSEWKEMGGRQTNATEKEDLIFANIICKHLKSNAIAVVKNLQLIGKGCGQTSRIDALKQAIEKANYFRSDLQGAVMASDAFFPFDDCVKVAYQSGITAFIQPGGSIRDNDSIDYCKQNNLPMVITGTRHFKH